MGAPNFYQSGLVSLLFASLWFSSVAKADYNRFCPNQAGQVQVDSTFYTVTCDTSYISPAPKKVKESASPEECARLCTAEPACHGMVWHAGNCWQSDKSDAISLRVPGAVLLTPGEKHDPATGPSEGQRQCLEEKEQLAQEKEQCGTSLAQCAAEKSSISAAKTTCENSLAAANKEIARLSNPRMVPDSFVPARNDDGREVVIAGKRWKIYYAKLNDPGAWDVGTLNQPSYMACMKLCASKPNCVRTAWVNDVAGTSTCWMRSHGQHTVQTTTQPWTSTHLIGPA
ncbi:uncharacterized protein P174DRAFT_508299 [Aspergillus novofumigatus IBT 16806]|uniref:Apple domain-containing protein n=1 Tax=Aspergillus novofumigatus (strain IBT 16806) TaxID=1392255 RepID=A0A2I1CJW4_ASPN1|nr:uncharacterized protein P174DRAFT_508299 [Aspergillus novofumigatus IBT 16806]PKX97908.1 hypothetical protein P174DRAFT_508299 [Aspergillus novofumigatus IBT 16806]